MALWVDKVGMFGGLTRRKRCAKPSSIFVYFFYIFFIIFLAVKTGEMERLHSSRLIDWICISRWIGGRGAQELFSKLTGGSTESR